jgi:hypothetical protein
MFSNLSAFTKLHVVISLIGILSGLVVMFGLLVGQKLNRWTAVFLISTVATSLTGFIFPFHGVTPAIVVGIISLVLLAGAIVARYARHPCWTLALDLCGVRDVRTLLECLRPGRATLSEGAGTEGNGAHTVRAAICCYTTGRARAVCLANHFRCDQVSRRTTKEGLTLTLNSND